MSADLQLSVDGGQTWTTTIATGLSPIGNYSWTVPAAATNEARVRVVIHDASGNTGTDQSDSDFSIDAPFQASYVQYGSGKAGTLGVPDLDASADPELGASINLELRGGLPHGTAHFIRGFSSAATPFDGAEILVDYNKVYSESMDVVGRANLSGTVPNKPNLVGVSLYWQVWIPNDPNAAGQGWSCSNGLETVLGY